MLHSTYLGFFDRSTACLSNLDVTRPLDMKLVRTIVEKYGGILSGDSAHVDRDRFVLGEGYLRCMDFVQSRPAAAMIAEIANATGCDILFLETGSFQSPQEFLRWFEWSLQARADRRQRA